MIGLPGTAKRYTLLTKDVLLRVSHTASTLSRNEREPHCFAFLRYVVYPETTIADLVSERVYYYGIRRKVYEG